MLFLYQTEIQLNIVSIHLYQSKEDDNFYISSKLRIWNNIFVINFEHHIY